MVNHRGRCYHLHYIKVADVIAIPFFVGDGKPCRFHVTAFEVADGMAIAGWVTGRSYYHWQMV